jgi:L-alanine-DL-glutamate epimerase-like enolase superfamily enzyme
MACVVINTASGATGEGYTYALRAGGYSQYELAKEFAPILIGEDPNDISRLWDKLAWAGNTLGENGLINQTISAFDTALWDLKAKKAGLPLYKLLGSNTDAVPCYNTSGGYLTSPIETIVENAKKWLAKGMGGIKIKVGQPDSSKDIERVKALREALGPDVPIMADVNQQWDLSTAMRVGKELDKYNLTWLEEPLNAHDVEGHKILTETLSTPVGTGEMLSSLSDVLEFIDRSAVNVIMPDAPRMGGITPFMKVLDRAKEKRLMVAPHFVMEMHLPLIATYAHEAWIELIEWLQPVFNEKVDIKDGKMLVPQQPGIGFTFNKDAFSKMLLVQSSFR